MKSNHPVPPARNRWAAATIVAPKTGCAPAQALRDRRFLAGEAPALPLADCPTPHNCSCKYRKFDDRRDGPRRDIEATGIRRFVPPDQERRRGGGRRSSD